VIVRKPVALVALSLILAAGCGPGLGPDDLPPLPDTETSGNLPGVARQLADARALVTRRPTQAKANGELGMLYRVYRDYESAEIAFRRARMLAPRNADWAYYHGESLEHVARLDEALAAMQKVLQLAPGDVPARLHMVELLTRSGDLEGADAAIASLLQDEPDEVGVHTAHAALLERQNRPEEALEEHARSLELGGHFGRAHYSSALLQRRLGDAAEADRHMMLFDRYRNVSYRRNDPRLRKLFALNQSDKPVVRAAQAAKARGDDARALALLEVAIERNPASQETRAALVAGYTASGKLAEAERHYVAGATRDPEHVELQFSLGRLRLANGRLAEAIAVFENVTRRSPQHPQARAWLGNALQLRGRTDEAGAQLRRAVDDDPKNPTARRYYAEWLLAHGDPAEAIEQLRRMAAIPSADGPVMYRTLSRVLARSGDRAGAIEALDVAIEQAQWQENRTLASSLYNDRGRLALGAPETGS
jgi:tetratricopeptide (TPR) repeat protein